MRILWIVNTIFPYPAKQIGMPKNDFGGWLNGLAIKLKNEENIKLAIATVYNGKDIREYENENIIYYLIPGAPAIKYNKRLENYWREINNRFKPDLVHIHGTEFAHGLAFINACPNVKTVTSIQGLVGAISKVYYANMKMKDIIKNITIRDILRRDTIIQAKTNYGKRGENEIQIIKKTNAIIGRTTWDYANCKAINKEMKYYHLDETLRENFYNSNEEWDINKIDRETIYFSQASYPIKGFHILLDAVNILKETYPNIKVYVAGYKITDKSLIKRSGYAKIIEKKIKQYHLENNINFMGILNQEEVRKKLLKTHVFVSSSVIENESNSLTEAAILGLPAVCSYVGGIPDRVINEKSGLLYPFSEPSMLANCIQRYFENDEIAVEYGKEARKIAMQRNNPENNVKKVIEIYKSII